MDTPSQRTPIYVRIAGTLRERIVAGAYPLGSLLPTEAELGGEFGTSRNTIREALRRIVNEGLIRRRQGAGSVVTSATPLASYTQSFDTLEDLFANATNTHYVVNEISQARLAPEIAERVGGAPGQEWLVVTGVRWTERGGSPIAFVESYVPAAYQAIVDTFWRAKLPFYALLENATGHTITEVLQDIRATEMPRRVANSFGLAEGSLSLQLLRRYVTRQGTLIASANWHRADQFTYRMTLHRHTDGPP